MLISKVRYVCVSVCTVHVIKLYHTLYGLYHTRVQVGANNVSCTNECFLPLDVQV